MSSFEALRAIRDKGVAWLNQLHEPEPAAPPPPTPLDEAGYLLALAKMSGQIDRESGTFHAVARWAAAEIIIAQISLESATEEKSAALRSRIRTLRDLIDIDDRAEDKPLVPDDGPYVP